MASVEKMATSWYSVSSSIGKPMNAPRCSSPLSFLRRVPYSRALLMMSAIFLAFGSLCLTDGAHVRSLNAPKDFTLAARNFTQVVDHFNSLDGRTFHQRYWEDQRWWKFSSSSSSSSSSDAKTYPLALLKINSFHSDSSWNYSTIAAWAKELGAIVYDLEPRYAGQSYPLPDVTTPDLRFYTIEQTVADVVSFISNQGTNLPNGTRWVVMGELFDGAFATWTRAKPRVAFGVIAVSPYLLAVDSYPEYDDAYQSAIGTKCAGLLHDLLGLVTWTLQSGDGPNAEFQRKCGVDGNDTLPDAEFITFDKVSGADNATKLATLANYTVAFNRVMGMNFTEWDFARNTATNLTSYGATYRPTYYLKCAQLGQFEVPSVKFPDTSLVPPQRDLGWYLSVCKRLFANLTSDRPNVNQVNANFGGRVPEGCNMAFVLSKHDPYYTLGPDPVAISAKAKTTGNKIIQLECASSQAAFSFFSPEQKSDPTCLRKARATVFQTLRGWQTQVDACPSPALPPSGGGGKHEDGDMALVGVFSAIGGIILGVAAAGGIFYFLSRTIIRKWKTSAYEHVN